MDKYIYNKMNGLWYERCGDYYLPCLALDEEKPVGVWGERYRRYLKEHRRSIYNEMLLNGTLDDHVAEIDRKADEMFERLTAEMATREGITEQLKATNQMAWIGAMNNIDARVKEVIYKDLIFAL